MPSPHENETEKEMTTASGEQVPSGGGTAEDERLSWKLCYVAYGVAWFTPTDPTGAWGDDWDDAPYECNAGAPYGESVTLAYDGDLDVPSSGHFNSPWTVEKINQGAVPWLRSPSYVKDNAVRIMAGTSVAAFIEMVEAVGGTVYVPRDFPAAVATTPSPEPTDPDGGADAPESIENLLFIDGPLIPPETANQAIRAAHAAGRLSVGGGACDGCAESVAGQIVDLSDFTVSFAAGEWIVTVGSYEFKSETFVGALTDAAEFDPTAPATTPLSKDDGDISTAPGSSDPSASKESESVEQPKAAVTGSPFRIEHRPAKIDGYLDRWFVGPGVEIQLEGWFMDEALVSDEARPEKCVFALDVAHLQEVAQSAANTSSGPHEELLRVGDLLQSSASRLAENVGATSYEVEMAAFEAKRAVAQWTELRKTQGNLATSEPTQETNEKLGELRVAAENIVRAHDVEDDWVFVDKKYVDDLAAALVRDGGGGSEDDLTGATAQGPSRGGTAEDEGPQHDERARAIRRLAEYHEGRAKVIVAGNGDPEQIAIHKTAAADLRIILKATAPDSDPSGERATATISVPVTNCDRHAEEGDGLAGTISGIHVLLPGMKTIHSRPIFDTDELADAIRSVVEQVYVIATAQFPDEAEAEAGAEAIDTPNQNQTPDAVVEAARELLRTSDEVGRAEQTPEQIDAWVEAREALRQSLETPHQEASGEQKATALDFSGYGKKGDPSYELSVACYNCSFKGKAKFTTGYVAHSVLMHKGCPNCDCRKLHATPDSHQQVSGPTGVEQ